MGKTNKIDFKKIAELLPDALKFERTEVKISMPLEVAKAHLLDGLNFVLGGKKAEWLPEYDEIAEWLSNNEGKGLLCIGNCGRGKTLLVTKVIPLILEAYGQGNFHLIDSIFLNDAPREELEHYRLIIDDFGIESVRCRFGEKRIILSEIVDRAEKKGGLLLLTTNCSFQEILEKYGLRTVDRLSAITRQVYFTGDSLRK